ncbi:hypothetical protein mru_0971 [Methanobrevibacter ruminantium M1]|uniref:Uncharacterized protein n=1 Tax=Methanobrevibacter ruminantium (strain ATCC 35063 / DSM 1093 / JCM 13430 / OCM 146 / M1) TaxID=634498 RepID=D3E2R1_METRM|nr:hypothetical protein [Methanobrevibacter ruminantium]ADC46822.1 hypothetical protein mru_0971 [Methanobrevibacter ruminantium M1]
MNMSFEEYAVMAINHHIEERNKYLKKEIKAKEEEIQAIDEKIQAKEEEIQAIDEKIQTKEEEIQAKEEKINKIRKLFKDFCENEDEEAMNTIKSILL